MEHIGRQELRPDWGTERNLLFNTISTAARSRPVVGSLKSIPCEPLVGDVFTLMGL